MPEPLIYLASPYSHLDPAIRAARFQDACRYAAGLMKAGHLIFCPIAHTHPICLYGQLKTGWDFWQKYDRIMLERSDVLAIVPLDGWQQSTGMKGEVSIWVNELDRAHQGISVVTSDYRITECTNFILESYSL